MPHLRALGGLRGLEHDRHGDVRLPGFWARRRPQLVPALLVAIVLAIGVSQAIGMPLETSWILATLLSRPILFSATSLAATGVVVAAARETLLARLLGWTPLVALGRISYGLYLYHVIVFVGLAVQPVALRRGAAIALATASWWLLERPILRFKARFERAPTGAVAPAAALRREG